MYDSNSPESIQKMFGSIAKNYDLANTALSFGLHKKWNRHLVTAVGPAKHLLDLCAGTGEIAFGFLKKNPKAKAILLDFCPEMLEIAEKKGASSFKKRFQILQADAAKIPLKNELVDAVTISYGIRNVKEPEMCFKEVHRILKKGGVFAILELTRPNSSLLYFMHRLYLRTCLPLLGKLTAKNRDAYRYLAKSVQEFISPEALEAQLKATGFRKISKKKLFGGTATLIRCFKS